MKAIQKRILSVWFEPSLAAGFNLLSSKSWSAEVIKAQDAIWFGTGRSAEEKKALDDLLAEEFSECLEAAGKGALKEWEAEAESCLSLLILCDQMSRNIHRGSKEAFALDGANQAVTKRAMAQGLHLQFPSFLVRQFFYLPLMHAESRQLQEECVAIYEEEVKAAKEKGTPAEVVEKIEGTLPFAKGHRDVVERFGRFPTSECPVGNKILGRESTPEEVEFLKTADSWGQ